MEVRSDLESQQEEDNVRIELEQTAFEKRRDSPVSESLATPLRLRISPLLLTSTPEPSS